MRRLGLGLGLSRRGPVIRNLLLQANNIGASPWTGGIVVSASAEIAPDGSGATTLAENSAAAIAGRSQVVTVAPTVTAYTGALYIKAGTSGVASLRVALTGGTSGAVGEGVINLATGATQWRTSNVGTALSATSAGNGWWRFAVTVTNNANGNTSLTFDVRPAFAATYVAAPEIAATGSIHVAALRLTVGAA